jgi:hypothetical protein
MRQEQLDQLVRDIVRTLRNAGVTVSRIIDWSRNVRDDNIVEILRQNGFTDGQIADFTAKGALNKGDIWGIMREQR